MVLYLAMLGILALISLQCLVAVFVWVRMRALLAIRAMKYEKVQTKLPTDLKTQLKAEAALAGLTQAELIAKALTYYFEKHSMLKK